MNNNKTVLVLGQILLSSHSLVWPTGRHKLSIIPPTPGVHIGEEYTVSALPSSSVQTSAYTCTQILFV
jgi:hypothetical protein